MIKIEWFRLLKNHIWFGWVYFGSPGEGHPLARDNWIYWCHYSEQGWPRAWKPQQ